MEFVNCTPHEINLNSGESFLPSGNIARVSATFLDFDKNGICSQVFGKIENLPESVPDTIYIVSAMVLSASTRKDLVAPATGHPETIRNEKGQIVSVPGFIR